MRILFILSVIITLAIADTKIMKKESHGMKGGGNHIKGGYQFITLCVDGYKFFVAKIPNGISTVQMYEARSGTKPARPIECD